MSVESKAAMLAREDRIATLEKGWRYRVEGDHAYYTVTVYPERYHCECPAHGRCSHALAVWSVVEGIEIK